MLDWRFCAGTQLHRWASPLRLRCFLALLAGASMAWATGAAAFDTPEGAVRALEAAYAAKDVDAAVGAIDFREEARLLLESTQPDLASDNDVLKLTAQALELSFREQIHDKGFPQFADRRCRFTAKKTVSATLVRLTEECIFPDGAKSVQAVFASRGERGWRVVTVPGAS
jgi:hypothetical protein